MEGFFPTAQSSSTSSLSSSSPSSSSTSFSSSILFRYSFFSFCLYKLFSFKHSCSFQFFFSFFRSFFRVLNHFYFLKACQFFFQRLFLNKFFQNDLLHHPDTLNSIFLFSCCPATAVTLFRVFLLYLFIHSFLYFSLVLPVHPLLLLACYSATCSSICLQSSLPQLHYSQLVRSSIFYTLSYQVT